MRIAFLSREYPPDTAWGGLATLYHSLASSLAQHGHEVHVICQAIGKPAESVEDSVFVHKVGSNPKRYSAVARINYMIHAWLTLRDIISRHGIDVVEANYWGAEAFLYTFKKRVPLIIRVDVSARDMLLTKTYSGIKERAALKALSVIEDYSILRADRVISISKDMYASVIDRLHITADKVDTVLHGIDTARYRFVKSNIRERFEIPQSVPLVLFVGRMEARKGVHVLCQAIPQVIRVLPMTRFVFVGRDTQTAPGGGSVRSHISKSGKQNGFASNLHFMDFLPPDELVKMYSACDVFVLPSFREGCGLVILEALACGKPVVATDTGLVPELSLMNAGVTVVPQDNAERLATAILDTLSINDVEKRLIAKRNRSLIETRFSISMWVDKIVQVYEKTLNER
jgi:glycogen(starch) synthase